MKNNSTSISAENVKAAMSLAVELAKEGDLEKSVSDRLENADAAKIIADIDAGIAKFDATYEKAANGDSKTVVGGEIDAALAEKTEEEKKTALAGIVTSLGGDPEDMTLDELKKSAVEYINEYSVMNVYTGGGLEQALDALGAQAAENVIGVALNGNSRRYVAAALFILRERGNTDIPADMTAETFGVYTAAAVASSKAMQDYAEGKTTWEKVKQVLKLAATVAVCVILVDFLLFAVVTAAFAVPIIFAIHPILVYAIVILTSAILAVGLVEVAEKAADSIYEAVAPGVAAIVGLWKKFFSWVKEKVAPKANEHWNAVKQKFASVKESVFSEEELEEEEELEANLNFA